jgi:alkaline phosphatase D
MKALGPIVGHVTSTTAKVWFRAADTAAVEVRTGAGEWKAHAAAANPARSFIAVAELAGLVPATEYQYRFVSAAGPIDGAEGRFTTLAGNPDQLSFAFASCHKPTSAGAREEGFERWSALADAMWSHDFLILCGDQIYEDGLWPPKKTAAEALGAWVQQYESHWGDDRFRQVTAFSPTYMMWDDHEIRDDWGSRRGDWSGDDEKRAFAAAADAYQIFQNSHNPPGDGGPRPFGFRVGAAAFYFFDLRGERGKDPTYPVLGKAQFNGFLEWMSTAGRDAELLFVVTSVPIAHVSQWAVEAARAAGKDLDIDTADAWDDDRNAPDLVRLLDTLFHLQCDGAIKQVFVLGGDVHVATACQIRSSNPQHAKNPVIHQFTSSPISNAPPSWVASLFSGLFIRGTQDLGAGYEAINTRYLARRNFGEVSARRASGVWTVEFSINAEDGGVLNPWATVRCPRA